MCVLCQFFKYKDLFFAVEICLTKTEISDLKNQVPVERSAEVYCSEHTNRTIRLSQPV